MLLPGSQQLLPGARRPSRDLCHRRCVHGTGTAPAVGPARHRGSWCRIVTTPPGATSFCPHAAAPMPTGSPSAPGRRKRGFCAVHGAGLRLSQNRIAAGLDQNVMTQPRPRALRPGSIRGRVLKSACPETRPGCRGRRGRRAGRAVLRHQMIFPPAPVKSAPGPVAGSMRVPASITRLSARTSRGSRTTASSLPHGPVLADHLPQSHGLKTTGRCQRCGQRPTRARALPYRTSPEAQSSLHPWCTIPLRQIPDL